MPDRVSAVLISAGIAPSLRRRLLTFLAVPVTIALIGGAALTYFLALHYANVSYDRSLLDSAHALERLMRSEAGTQELSPQARILFEYDGEDPTYYVVRSMQHGVLASNLELPAPLPLPDVSGAPIYDFAQLPKRRVRTVSIALAAEDPADRIVVTVAETLRARYALAREILVGTLPIELALILVMLLLVWLGVSRGLRLLDPLVAQLRARSARDLEPLGSEGVPVEILPLTRTIDTLLGRLKHTLALQERFIADAAHQLRTPLAGLRLQAERALSDPQPEAVRDALAHVERLAAGAGRAAGQLLALARAQTPEVDRLAARRLDLAELARAYVAERVPDALGAAVDLGYEGPVGGVEIAGDPVLLREALVNLVDNAIRYAGARSTVTVSITDEGEFVTLSVEDDGPGVPEDLWRRLGERFFRVPGTTAEGSGLGLAIVREIVDGHRARLRFARGAGGAGFRVRLRFARLGADAPSDQSERSSRV